MPVCVCVRLRASACVCVRLCASVCFCVRLCGQSACLRASVCVRALVCVRAWADAVLWFLSRAVLTPAVTDEDCLFVNVWVPSADGSFPPAKPLPILVWFYGGAFMSGALAWMHKATSAPLPHPPTHPHTHPRSGGTPAPLLHVWGHGVCVRLRWKPYRGRERVCGAWPV